MLTTLKRRQPGIPVILYPTPVQGKGAAELIAKAIRTASTRHECDVLIVCRGGGSMEDLWSFNEEVVARAIVDCSMPVISGVGHETDFTIADFAADVRAPTPTAAAELVSADREGMLRQLQQTHLRLQRQMRYMLGEKMQRLDILSHRLVHPGERLKQRHEQMTNLQTRLKQAMSRRLETQSLHVVRLGQNLEHLAPQQVLNRGYSLVRDAGGQLVTHANQVEIGDRLSISFAQGGADTTVISK